MNGISKRQLNLLLITWIVFMAVIGVASAADGSDITTLITPGLVGTGFLVGLYGAFKFAEQSWGSDPTKWSYLKFIQVFVAALLVSVVIYLSTGVLQPATIEQITQGLAVLGGSVLTILGWKTATNVKDNGTLINPEVLKPAATTPTTATPAATPTTTPAAGSSGWQPDFSVTPTFPRVKSGNTVIFNLDTGAGDQGQHACKEIIIDWMDGSPLQSVPVVKGFAQVSHTYTYVAGTSQYDSHEFFPEFTVVDSFDGAKKSFNTEGRACTVQVDSLLPAAPIPKV